MKKLIITILSACAAILLLLLGTSSSPKEYDYYSPFFMTRAKLENSIKFIEGEQKMENPGKIYIKGDYIFVNEKYMGVHVINNSDPKPPRREGFIVIPGCIDMVAKDNILYADNAVDLVAIDLATRQVTKRIRNHFPEPLSPSGSRFDRSDRPDELIVVGWTKKTSN